MDKQKTAWALAIAGIIPFFAGTLLVIMVPDSQAQTIAPMVLAYGAVIASFIAGIHWGIYLFRDAPVNLFISSNVIALLVWAAVLLGGAAGAALLLACFAALLWIDHRLCLGGVIDVWFFRLRFRISLAVATLLLIFLAIIA